VGLGVGQVHGVDVDLSVPVETIERDLRSVGAEGRIAGFDEAVANHRDHLGGPEVEIDARP